MLREPTKPSGDDGEASAACDVSVVIVNWNTRAILRDCLSSLQRHTRRRTVEVLVVDNGSADGSPQMVRDEFPAARLIANPKNLGYAAGCNQGIREARGRHLLLLNSDTRLEDDAISALADVLEERPGVGVVGCALVYADGAAQASGGHFPSLWGAVLAKLDRARARDCGPRGDFAYPYLSRAEHGRERVVDWVKGAVMLVRREAAEAVGPLDESIFLFAEEWDWCYRMRTAGWKVLFVPEPHVVHLGSASWVASDGFLSRSQRAGVYFFYRKHYGRATATCFQALSAAGAAARTATSALRYLAAPGAARAAARRRLGQEWDLLRWTLSQAPGRILRSDDLRAEAAPEGAPRAG
jgi:N-acetylglucosaminyl-diphospho-decaprenol L-rhamnosyltransferase